MKFFSHVKPVLVYTSVLIKPQKAFRKFCFIWPLLFCHLISVAQFKQDVALQRTLLPHSAPVVSGSATPKRVASSAKAIVEGIKKKLVKKNIVSKSNPTAAAEKMVLYAERLDEEHIVVFWNGAAGGSQAKYIIERRFGDPHGSFDSVGTVTSRSTDPVAQRYRHLDKNTFTGSTFYRLRNQSVHANEGGKTSVMVNGSNRGLQVSSAPAVGGTITVTLSKFKIAPHTHLYITDAHGSLVYQKKNVFFSTAQTIELTGVQLPRGTYQIEVTNHYNTGMNSLIIR